MVLRMLVPTLALSAFCGLQAAESSSGNYMVRLKAAAWFATANDTSVSANDVSVDYEDFENTEAALLVEGGVKVPLLPLVPDVAIGFTTWETDGDNDNNFETSDFWLEAIWGIDIGDLAGAGVGLAAHNANVTISTAGGEADDDEWVPAVAARAWVHPIDSIDVQARLHLADWGDNQLTDFEVHGSWYALPHIGLLVGGRLFSYELDLDDGVPENMLYGPYLGVAAQF